MPTDWPMPRPAHSAEVTLRASSGSRMKGASEEMKGSTTKPPSFLAMTTWRVLMTTPATSGTPRSASASISLRLLPSAVTSPSVSIERSRCAARSAPPVSMAWKNCAKSSTAKTTGPGSAALSTESSRPRVAAYASQSGTANATCLPVER